MIGEKLQKATESYSLQLKADKANRIEKDRTEEDRIEHDPNRKGIGVATATLIGKPSASFRPMSTEDIQPLLMIDSLPDDVFKDAVISKDIVTDIISHFCTAYRENMHKPCPHISEEFSREIPSLIANLIDRNTGEILLDSDKWKRNPERYTQWYTDMIDKYFDTKFSEGCDYSLLHFFSGDIRALRFHEIGRMPYDM